jgi:hypothetical protein
MSAIRHRESAKPLVLILQAELPGAAGIGSQIGALGNACRSVGDVASLGRMLDKRAVLAVVLDMDSMPLDNASIGKLVRRHPRVVFFGFSRERFHPELQEAIGAHLFACLCAPIGDDELRFWLKCAAEHGHRARASPVAPGSKPTGEGKPFPDQPRDPSTPGRAPQEKP